MLKKILLAMFMVYALSVNFAFCADKININTATVEQLEVLQGVGPATAKAIVEYRTVNGNFKNIEELNNVKGIGEKKMAKLAGSLTIEE